MAAFPLPKFESKNRILSGGPGDKVPPRTTMSNKKSACALRYSADESRRSAVAERTGKPRPRFGHGFKITAEFHKSNAR
jgi:hypothetical protein